MVNLTQSVQTKQTSSIYQVEILQNFAEANNEAFSVAFEIWKGNKKTSEWQAVRGKWNSGDLNTFFRNTRKIFKLNTNEKE